MKIQRRGGGTRLEFRCGGRALRDYREKHDVVSRLTSALTVGHRELNDTVARLQTDNKTLRTELKAAREQLAERKRAGAAVRSGAARRQTNCSARF